MQWGRTEEDGGMGRVRMAGRERGRKDSKSPGGGGAYTHTHTHTDMAIYVQKAALFKSTHRGREGRKYLQRSNDCFQRNL